MQQGELVEWNDLRGFGFIRADDDGERIFVHISSIGRIANRPRAGDKVSFVIGTRRDGRRAASNVRIANANPYKARPLARGRQIQVPRRFDARVSVAVLLILLLLFGLFTGTVPVPVAALYALMGLVSAWFYFSDKQSAKEGAWRVSENTLHGFDLAFGIIGGLLAQHLLRHKTSKAQFAVMSYCLAGLHLFWLGAIVTGRISLAELWAFIFG